LPQHIVDHEFLEVPRLERWTAPALVEASVVST
jgi:hypothetical protein